MCLITGAGVRLGREMAKGFHAAGCTIAIHYRSSRERAEELEALLNQTRAGSSACFNADVGRVDDINKLVGRSTGVVVADQLCAQCPGGRRFVTVWAHRHFGIV